MKLMYSTNSSGPSTDPWRTPLMTGTQSSELTHYYSLLFVEQEGSYPVQSLASDSISEDNVL